MVIWNIDVKHFKIYESNIFSSESLFVFLNYVYETLLYYTYTCCYAKMK